MLKSADDILLIARIKWYIPYNIVNGYEKGVPCYKFWAGLLHRRQVNASNYEISLMRLKFVERCRNMLL